MKIYEIGGKTLDKSSIQTVI